MSDLHDQDDEPVVLDFVQDAPVTYADTECARLPDDGPDARWPGINGQSVNSGGNSFANRLVQFAKRLAGALLDLDPKGHGLSLEPSFGLGLLPGDNGLTSLASGAGCAYVSRVSQILE